MTLNIDLQAVFSAFIMALVSGGAGYIWWRKKKEKSQCDNCGVTDDIRTLKIDIKEANEKLEENINRQLDKLENLLINHIQSHIGQR